MALQSKAAALRKVMDLAREGIEELEAVTLDATMPIRTKLTLSLVLDRLEKIEQKLEQIVEHN